MCAEQRLAWIATVVLVVAAAGGRARGESKHVFGVHTWDWGANLDVMSGKTGWIVEAMLAHDSPNVWGRYVPACAEGFTVIQRLDYSWESTIPPDPALYPEFAYNCAHNWARNLKRYCRHYMIGNEIDFDFTPDQYVLCFQQVRDAIKAEQPNAKVIVGHWNAGGHVRETIQLLGPEGYDGVTCHTGSTVPTSLLDMLDEEGARSEVGVYISEWGWVAGTNPNAQGVMMQFCQDLADWNANHDRQVYCACWYAYPHWFHHVFSLEDSPIDNAAFENMTANCACLNSYGDNPITVSHPRVEVSSANEALQVRWHTDVPSTSQIWFWNQTANNGEWRPTQAQENVFWNRVIDHQVEMSGAPHVQPETEYLLVCRSTEDDYGDGSSEHLKVTSGPWTVTAGNLTESSAMITWQTLFPSSSRIEYGETPGYGSGVIGPDGVTGHVVQLDGLRASTTYHYRVWSEATDYAPHHSADQTFQTATPVGPFIEVWPVQIGARAWVLANPPNDTFSIRNGGSGTITYAITPGCPWVSVDAPGGTSSGETDIIDIIYHTAGLSAGEHSCTLTIEAPEAHNSPVVAPAITLMLSTVNPDFDGDGDVDQEDFGHLQACLSGPGLPQIDPACQDARLDLDEDVDRDDFDILRACLSGANVPAAPACGG